MGGRGSGDYYRWRTKSTTESVRQLDVRQLQRQGRLTPGGDFRCHWSDGGVVGLRVASLTHEGRAIMLALNYNVRVGGGAWEEVHELVRLTWTPCNYGGWRPWFYCPVESRGVYCGRRVAILFGAGRYFACRRCYDLAYPSSREDAGDRALRKAQAIRVRLGGSASMHEPFPPKPKGMHWDTYDRLWRAAHAAERVSDAAFWTRLAGIRDWIDHHSAKWGSDS